MAILFKICVSARIFLINSPVCLSHINNAPESHPVVT